MNSTWLITSELANQRARKVLFTCVVYTKKNYSRCVTVYFRKNVNVEYATENFQEGKTVRFKCNRDHDLVGNDTILCKADGIWRRVSMGGTL